ncbi:hypothetical protein BKA93DRAFT_712740, partial [Sparassis latifolia]
YRLCGMIYFGGFHFTSRIVTADKQVWYNDGISTGTYSKFECSSNILAEVENRRCSIVIYCKI